MHNNTPKTQHKATVKQKNNTHTHTHTHESKLYKKAQTNTINKTHKRTKTRKNNKTLK